MARSRAILTETEREQIAGEHGDKRRYEATSRARARVRDELAVDIEILREHNPDLLDEIREVVCPAAAVDADPNAADRDTPETGEDRREIDPSHGETQRSGDGDNGDESATTLDADDLEGNPESTIDDPQAGDELGNGNDDGPDTFAGVIDAVAADEWEDTDARLADRKAAARAVLEYARDNGSVSKQEAKEDIYPDHGVEGQNARTWYRKNIRPVLNEAAEYDQSARGYKLVVDDAQGDGGLDTDNDEDDAEFSF